MGFLLQMEGPAPRCGTLGHVGLCVPPGRAPKVSVEQRGGGSGSDAEPCGSVPGAGHRVDLGQPQQGSADGSV
jgi:hypothetical protein